MVLNERPSPAKPTFSSVASGTRGAASDRRSSRGSRNPRLARGKTRNRLDLASGSSRPKIRSPPGSSSIHLWGLMFGQGLVARWRTSDSRARPRTIRNCSTGSPWSSSRAGGPSACSPAHRHERTFLQDSAVTPELLERDPDNRLLARFPRHRLPAWMIRDHALAASGLLNPALGGRP